MLIPRYGDRNPFQNSNTKLTANKTITNILATDNVINNV